MKEGLDIAWISVPFVAGVAIAALLGAGPAVGGACLLGAGGCIAAITLRHSRSGALVAALFLLLGAFAYSSRNGLPAGNSPLGSSPFGLTPPSLRDGPPASVPRVARPSGGVPSGKLLERALEQLSATIARIPFEHQRTNALLRALLTGRRDLLDRGTAAAFRAAGASHILALSGLHLGIIYLIISRLLWFLGNSPRARRVRSSIIVLLCGFYTVMTGAGPSIVRAFIFITLAEIARNCPGRKRRGVNIWCAAAMLQLCANPAVIGSVGFQLSYLAMLGIFTLFPVLKGWYPSAGEKRDRWNLPKKMWEAMALSVSCQVFTAPLVWLRFRTFPKYFLLSNLISLPLTEALITGGLAATALEAAKKSPHLLTRAVDRVSELLCRSLEIISSIP